MRLIILDRDGVINHDSDNYIKSKEEWIPIPGSLEAIARLNQAGFHVVVATNQSGIARGFFNTQTLNTIHQKMYEEAQLVGAKIDAIFFCPHKEDDHCGCRKPRPGLFYEIAQRYQTNLKNVPVIGDSLRDLEAGVAAGCTTPYLVLTGKGKQTQHNKKLPAHTQIFPDLSAAVDAILKNSPFHTH
jgi:D-glycero-D-manno-heptose 1,7-bisphosphate phosphatase